MGSIDKIEVRRKGNLTPEFAEDIKEQIEKETAPIVLIDVGGKISPENETIFSACNYAIILDITLTAVH